MRQWEGMPQPREEQVGPQEAQPCKHGAAGGAEGSGHLGTGVWGRGGWEVSAGLGDQEPPGECQWGVPRQRAGGIEEWE